MRRIQKGRGAQINTANRFQEQQLSEEEVEYPDSWHTEASINTKYFKDYPKTIVNRVDSPDVGLYYSINPYQGCEHGCIYCYARNSHEYWGFSAGLDFESRIILKANAPDLLRKKFQSPNWEVWPIALSGNTDCYQPAEKHWRITRQLLEVFRDYRHPVSIVTKNALILRDLDLLRELAANDLVKVHISITTLNEALRRKMEPRTAHAQKRLDVIRQLSENEIPVSLLLAPVIPGLNDEEIPAILKEAAANGVQSASYTVVRLNGAIGQIFEDWIHKNFPDRAQKVLNQIKSCHGEQLNDHQWGRRMKGEGKVAQMIHQLFQINQKKYFPEQEEFNFNLKAFRGPASAKQMKLFNQ